jgi:hypothetical protein
MCPRSRLLPLVFFLGVMVVIQSALADVWQGNLKSGGVIRIDPASHKPTVFYSGGSTQLWDGVHEMDDGSVVIVRDGVVVPNEVMFNTWSQALSETLTEKVDQCKKLLRKSCGFADECADLLPCQQARQLGDLQQQRVTPGAPSSCEEALLDEKTFPPCAEASATPTACQTLAQRVCGEKNQCDVAVPCNLAKQLLAMEREERLSNESPAKVTESGKQCQEAMGNRFFKACAAAP